MQTIGKELEDIFGDVVDIVEESQTLDFDLSHKDFMDGSLESNSNWTSTTDGILKRKPSRDNLKDAKKMGLPYSNAEKVKVMIENPSYRSPISVGAQLQRLENNLISTLSKRRSQYETGKQRKIVKRIKAEKENKHFGSSLEITSQQLRSIGEEDEQLKEILLTISRFYEKQKEKNEQLELQLAVLNIDLEEGEKALEKEMKQTSQLKTFLLRERLEADKIELEGLKSIIQNNQ